MKRPPTQCFAEALTRRRRTLNTRPRSWDGQRSSP